MENGSCFYQNFPFGAAHGVKIMGTKQKVKTWFISKETGVTLLPDTNLDSHGAYSGSAMQFGDKLFLFYTGNVRDAEWVRHPYKSVLWWIKTARLKKLTKSWLIKLLTLTDHFRDPQILISKVNSTLSLVVQDLEKKGFIRLYKAVDNDYSNWVTVGDLNFANDRTAYMMECPNLVFVGDQPVLLYCPQGR